MENMLDATMFTTFLDNRGEKKKDKVLPPKMAS